MKMKKIIVSILAVSLLIGLTACGASSKDYKNVSIAQKDIAKLSSGKIVVTSQYENADKSDTIMTEFLFKQNQKGDLSYCQTQFDQGNKAVYCEYTDGEKSEQWLVGNGWSTMDTTQYSEDNPHRYIKLLSQTFAKKAIDNIEVKQEETNKRYTFTLNPKVLNKTTYKDTNMQIISETVSYLLNDKNELICYNDTAKILDREAQSEALYMLEMQVSEKNAITEINKPELRQTLAKAEEAPADK